MSPRRVAVTLVVAATFLVYIMTQAPGLYYTDTGELAAAAATWGVAHPTGYPLFTLLGHVWTILWGLIPGTSVIGGLNVLAALFMAFAAGVVVVIVRRMISMYLPAVEERTALVVSGASALMFAFGPIPWAQTTALEVYGLQTLLLGLTLLFILDHRLKQRSLMAALCAGLMLANHVSSVFLLPGIVLWWWMSTDTPRQRLPLMLAFAAIGPSLYALLPLRSAAQPPINWGMVHRSWDAFLYHVKGTQFGVWMFSDSEAVATNAGLFADAASTQLLWIGWIAVVVGLVVLFRTQRSGAWALVLMIAGNLGISLGYAIPDIDAYFLPTLLLLSILCGLGIAAITRTRPRIVATVVPGLFAVAPLLLNYTAMNHRSHTAVDAYTRWALANADSNAIIITRQWDYLCSAFWYLQTVEGVRPDVTMIDKELLRRTWYPVVLEQQYPEVMQGAQAAVKDYLPWLERFESDAATFMLNPRNPSEIQQRFVAVLNALLEASPDRPVYITPELIGEESGFAVGYDAIPVGPLLLLTRQANTATTPATRLDHVDRLATSLSGRSTRLDDGMRGMIALALGPDAIYAAQFQGNRALADSIAQLLERVDTEGSVFNTVKQRIKP